MMDNLLAIFRDNGIRPTPQRLEVARYALAASDHPSADRVLQMVRMKWPAVSRATVYNTLHLLVEKGLLATRILKEGVVVFEPRVGRHHHFIDEKTGEIRDVPWHSLKVTGFDSLEDADVREYSVVLYGRSKRSRRNK
ncbi:MAG: transcriptional repressor [Chitinivibrionia bacterium]|nr:transcriptional repressor [Chitinivibrionia bacterium]